MARRKASPHETLQRNAWLRQHEASRRAEKLSVQYPQVKSVRVQIEYSSDWGKLKPTDHIFTSADGADAYFVFECPYWKTCLTSLNLNHQINEMVQKKETERKDHNSCMGNHREWSDGHKCLVVAHYVITIEYQ